MADCLRNWQNASSENPCRVCQTVSFSTGIKPATRLFWHCTHRATSGSGVINEVRLTPAPGAEDRVYFFA
jgi:hypothetical protein